MTREQAAIVAAMAGARALTLHEIAEMVGTEAYDIVADMRALEAAGRVRRLNTGSPTYWARTDLLEGLV